MNDIPMKRFPCKVCKLGSRNGEILEYIDNLLNQDLSYRKITKKIVHRFYTSISHESIRKHQLYCRQGLKPPSEDHPEISTKVARIKSRICLRRE